jgi:hypothetical protein
VFEGIFLEPSKLQGLEALLSIQQMFSLSLQIKTGVFSAF